ncbi:MAG: MGMT family protein [Pseudomonadales bacterium]
MGVTTKNSSSQRNKGIASKRRGSKSINGAQAQRNQAIDEPSREQAIWQVVSSIPFGQVASYGQIADLAGLPGRARFVGRVLANLPANSKLPWHRVVNAAGRISNRSGALRQRQRLEAEGVALLRGRVSQTQFWQP